MKILMIGQSTAVHHQTKIINPHKIMLTLDKQPDSVKIQSKVDCVLIGKDRQEEVEINKDGYFYIRNLFS